jgi:hypothetical protein
MTVQTPTSSTIPLHRIRFYDQTPSPITCLAYPPTALPAARDPSHKGKARAGNDELGVLVVARENGDVEIHQWARENEKSFGNWTCHRVSQRARAWTLSAKREMTQVRWAIEQSARCPDCDGSSSRVQDGFSDRACEKEADTRSYPQHSLTRVYPSWPSSSGIQIISIQRDTTYLNSRI